jgi:hypothetical protein
VFHGNKFEDGSRKREVVPSPIPDYLFVLENHL